MECELNWAVDYHPRLVAFARVLLAHSHDAENVAQEVLAIAARRSAEFDTSRPVWPWLRGIAVNVVRSIRRQNRRSHSLDTVASTNIPAAEGRNFGVLSGLFRQETAEQIAQAIAGLPALLREAFVLHAIEGLSYDEIAELTGESSGTLRVRGYRARQLLRGALGPVVDTWYTESAKPDKS